MDFYQGIADYYDDIFPLKEARLVFIESFLQTGSKNILDIGCATGELALALAARGRQVTGIDLDARMIEIAEWKAGKGTFHKAPRFLCRDMRGLGSLFEPASFDLALCFGNTLPHLKGLSEIQGFSNSVFSLLKSGAYFILQVVNFDHIFARGIRELPLIETDKVKFERSYEYALEGEDQTLLFSTTLTIKRTGRVIASSVPLFPLRFETLERALKSSGFSAISYFENENKKPFSAQSLSFIAAAKKN